MENNISGLYTLLLRKTQETGLSNVQIYGVTGTLAAPENLPDAPQIPRQVIDSVMEERKVVFWDLDGEYTYCCLPLVCNGASAGVLAFQEKSEYAPISSRLAASTVEMIIEKHMSYNSKVTADTSLQAFLYDWVYKDIHQQNDMFRHNAAINGIDISVKRLVCLVRFGDEVYSTAPISNYLRKEEFCLIHDRHTLLVIGLSNNALVERLQRVCNHTVKYHICVGPSTSDVHASYISASEALELCARFCVYNHVIYSNDLILERAMMSIIDTPEVRSLGELFVQKDPSHELRNTVKAYFELNGSNNEICQNLIIHRNTLLYRLNRIEQLTGYDPRSFKNLFILYCASMI